MAWVRRAGWSLVPAALSLGLAAGCGGHLETLSTHLPESATLDTLLFKPSSCALATAEAARYLPQDTAAMVVFDRPRELLAVPQRSRPQFSHKG